MSPIARPARERFSKLLTLCRQQLRHTKSDIASSVAISRERRHVSFAPSLLTGSARACQMRQRKLGNTINAQSYHGPAALEERLELVHHWDMLEPRPAFQCRL